MLHDIIERLKVQLANFSYKYGAQPKVIVLHPAHHVDEKTVYEFLSQTVPYLPTIDVIYSSKVGLEDFEVF